MWKAEVGECRCALTRFSLDELRFRRLLPEIPALHHNPAHLLHGEFAPCRESYYVILEGWFEDTLPKFPPGLVALLRLDGDWYDSTRCALENLAPRVIPGGFTIIDDCPRLGGLRSCGERVCSAAEVENAPESPWRLLYPDITEPRVNTGSVLSFDQL